MPAVTALVDFRKAFDSINKIKMLQIAKAHGISTQLVDAIGKTFEKTQTNDLSPLGETKITTSVLQGDTLAPYLFIIVLDYEL